ncbi:hypothetical protein F5Y19DRAFT_77913 [Xylariaceae sp. FL1651]|nr:hypothetical protein F5Y19DRAFT_77913 [Xylariaceae sp. FL1651]
MAELPAHSPNKHGKEPMAGLQIGALPERIDTASLHRDEGDAGPQRARADDTVKHDDRVSQAKAELNGPASEGTLALETSGVDTLTSEMAGDTDAQPEQVKKKKKKSRKTPKSRKNITGFEEYYADAPMTPAEAAFEKTQLYDKVRPFANRIEECIQRFRSRRRLDPERTNMFNKYLFLGGIDTSQRQFTGMAHDKDALAEADHEQIRSMTAVDFIGSGGNRFYDGSESDQWEVDFQAVVKGFLSRSITDWYMYDEKANQTAADLIKNFLNYILMHDVCPEHNDNVMAARHICDIAPAELRFMHELMLELPGTFNSAACGLFCEGMVGDLDKDENREALVQFRLTALLWPLSDKAKQAKEQILRAEDPTTIRVVSTKEETYRVFEIQRPRRKDKKTVADQLAVTDPNRELKPAGFIRVTPTIIAHGWGNVPRPDEVDFNNAEEAEFMLEDELLAKFEVGMKIRMTVCQLSVGIRFIKKVHDVRVSFDTFLPQYLLTDWKEPVPNERPPPSVYDPAAEEKAMGAEMRAED